MKTNTSNHQNLLKMAVILSLCCNWIDVPVILMKPLHQSTKFTQKNPISQWLASTLFRVLSENNHHSLQTLVKICVISICTFAFIVYSRARARGRKVHQYIRALYIFENERMRACKHAYDHQKNSIFPYL